MNKIGDFTVTSLKVGRPSKHFKNNTCNGIVVNGSLVGTASDLIKIRSSAHSFFSKLLLQDPRVSTIEKRSASNRGYNLNQIGTARNGI